MNKSDLVDFMYDRGYVGHTRANSDMALHEVLTSIREGLKKDGLVRLSGFGVFSVKTRAARLARNPRTGEKVRVPEKEAVVFKPSKDLLGLVQKKRPKPKKSRRSKKSKK